MTTSTFWHGKKVLVTGHTGFKGGWLTLWLKKLGAEVTGIALSPNCSPNLFSLARVADGIEHSYCDIRDASSLAKNVQSAKPEIVMHLAAQPLVRASYRAPLDTYATNVMGTANLLDSLRTIDSVKVAVVVTTDKVYHNSEWAYPYRENDPLGGHDPYSASKAASEIVVSSYRDGFLKAQGVAVASARAGNVIGGGDWSEDRLLPDAIRAWQNGMALDIRRPDSTRPWQHVLEPLAGYLTLAEKLWSNPGLAGPWNFGPNVQDTATVREVINLANAAFGRGTVRYAEHHEGPHEAGCLALETAKVRTELGIHPKWTLSDAVTRTINWYRAQYDGADARILCEAEIADYEACQ